eukprot:6182258-Pleurochrysis_carterae.AAC.2
MPPTHGSQQRDTRTRLAQIKAFPLFKRSCSLCAACTAGAAMLGRTLSLPSVFSFFRPVFLAGQRYTLRMRLPFSADLRLDGVQACAAAAAGRRALGDAG